MLIFAFYARKNTITPVLVGIVSVGMYLLVGVALLEPLGMPGLAFATSMQWTTHALLMIALMGRALGGWRGLGFGLFPLKVIVAAMVMGGMSRQSAGRGAGAAGAAATGAGLASMLTPLLDRNRDGSMVDDAVGFLGGLLSGTGRKS